MELIDLTYTYPDQTKALQGISLRILHGESVGIIGPNGAGKSTLLSHLTGLLAPSHGSVRIGDLPVNTKTLPQIRRTVGMVFQNSDEQLFMPTVFEDVAFGPHNLGVPAEELESRVLQALRTVGAEHLKNRPPYRLSGGEKRSVAIASVLSMLPDILVMDEPSASLDPLCRRQLIDLLLSFRHTKIIASHDLDFIWDICERVIVLFEGRVVADGSTREIFSNEDLLKNCHLEKPLRLQGCPNCGSKK